MAVASIFFYRGYVFIHRSDLIGDSHYVSDEVWYATSARNLLYKVFGVQAHYIVDDKSYWTLVFPNTSYVKNHTGIIRSYVERLGGRIVRDNYTKVPLVWIWVPRSVGEGELRSIPGVVDVRGGYQYPDKDGIHDYMNFEHPPLGKYLIIISMITLGDKPSSWRMPGLMEGTLLIIIAYLIGWKLAGIVGGLIGVASVALDPIVYAMSRVAMLDIHLAFFTGLTLLLLLYDKPSYALLASGLALSVKFSGLFAVLAAYLYLRLVKKKSMAYSLAASIILPLLVYVAIGYPLIMYRGLGGWIQDHLEAFAWHTTSRPSGPPASPPWGWLVNYNYVTLNYHPDIQAVVNAPGYVLAVLAALFFLPLARRREYAPSLMLISILLGYTLVYLRGNRTLYSFYAVQLSPAVAGVLASLAALAYRDVVRDAVRGWRRIASALISLNASLPSELVWVRAFIPRRRDARIPVLLMVSAVLISSMLQYYGVQVVPESPVLSLFKEHASSILAGSPPIPYSNYTYNGPGLAASLTYLSELVSGKGGVAGAYAMFTALILIAVLSLGYDLTVLEDRRPAYIFPLLLLFFGAYDWTLLAAALLVKGMLSFKEGRVWRASLLIGVAGAINPAALLFTLAILSLAPDYRVYVYTALGFIVANLPFIALWPSPWVSGTLWICRAVGFGGLGNLLGLGCLGETVAAALMLMLAYTASVRSRAEAWHRGAVLMVFTLILLSHVEPQWLLLALLFMGIRDWRHPEHLVIADLLASLAAVSWFRPDLITGPIFKYHPSSPLNAYSSPNLALYLMLLVAAHLSLIILYYQGRSRVQAAKPSWET